MARLHEHQGKALLAQRGVAIPRGRVVSTAREAADAAREIGGQVVLKIQAWTTGRAAIGGVAFAQTPEDAAREAERLLTIKVGAFPVEQVLVEEAIPIRDELFVSVSVDDAARAPVLLLSLTGGTGIEERGERVHRIPIDVRTGVNLASLHRVVEESAIDPRLRSAVSAAIAAICRTAKQVDARSLEVNPLVTTSDGRVMAADCRVTVDDYAVYRHPELGIDIARELDHPPTELERIAYRIEHSDHRGTFYFARLPVSEEARRAGKMIGFHGAGGGGSMMSMDAVSKAGFVPANFTDTSGNPSAAKVYAAARCILAQDGIVGYFGSGSGVASQEQHHSAYGLAKAFNEVGLSIPAVVRLGGNSEDRAVEVLVDACRGLKGKVEGYRKDDTPAKCAERFGALVRENGSKVWTPAGRRVPGFVTDAGARTLRVPLRFGAESSWGGTVVIDLGACDPATTALVVKHSGGVLKDEGGKPALAITPEEAAGKDSEMIACEIECRRAGKPVVFVDLPIPGLDESAFAFLTNCSTEDSRVAMAIIIDKSKRVLVQGITGREGRARTKLMREFGTNVVAGVTPGKKGEVVEGAPVFDSVRDAVGAATGKGAGIDISVVFAPARFVKDAAVEAIEAGVKTLVLVPDRVPLWDTMEIAAAAKERGAVFVGPNTLGVLSTGPEGAVVGMIGGRAESARAWFTPGSVGIISRSGGMTSSCGYYLSRAGVGLSTLVHVGGDAVLGLRIPDVAMMFQDDPTTEAIVVFGEIGGSQEEDLAALVRDGRVTKPVVAYIGGKAAKEGTRFSHAGAIIEGNRGTHAGKVKALTEAGASVVDAFGELPEAVVGVLKKSKRG